MPELDREAASLAQSGVGMLALSVAPEPAAVRDAATKLGLQLPVAYTEQEMLGPNGLAKIPSVLFVDKDGNVVDARSGPQSAASVRARALQLSR